jgi:RsiW-degrading membrane proteinase PrsW (M82 family)
MNLMNSLPWLLTLALAPGAYCGIRLYLKDKYKPESKQGLLGAFVVGGVIELPPALFELIVMATLGHDHFRKLEIAGALVGAFIVVAVAEEGAKFWVLRYYAYPRKEFSEPLDGIVYGAVVALGFATVENLFYVMHYGYKAGIAKMFITVPGHYVYGVIMGYYVGKAKFETQHQTAHMLRGLFYAIVLHGAYDFSLLQDAYPVLKVFTLAVWAVALIISHRKIMELLADSKRRCDKKPLVILAASLK